MILIKNSQKIKDLKDDEIISDYYNEFTNSRRSCFKGN